MSAIFVLELCVEPSPKCEQTKQNGEYQPNFSYVLQSVKHLLIRVHSRMSDIKDILEIEQASTGAPSKEAIVGGNKVNLELK